MRIRHAAVALALALSGIAVGRSPAAGQATLESFAATVADRWSRRDADGIAELVAKEGVALHLLDESQPSAGARQARAALVDLLAKGGSARIAKVEELGGMPRKGFAELGWEVRASAAEPGVRYTVFVAFVREDGGWRIAEIRVLR